MAKLAAGDMVAIDAVYHHTCLTRLSRQAVNVGCDISESNATQVMKAHVLNYVIDYIKVKHLGFLISKVIPHGKNMFYRFDS